MLCLLKKTEKKQSIRHHYSIIIYKYMVTDVLNAVCYVGRPSQNMRTGKNQREI